MYHQGHCPWMVWDPERSGPRRGARAAAAVTWRDSAPAVRSRRRAGRCRCWPSARTRTTSRSARAGPLLTLAESQPGLEVRYLVLTGTAERQHEARRGRGRVPARRRPHRRPARPARRPAPRDLGRGQGGAGADRPACSPDLVLAPGARTRTRTTGRSREIVPTVFRDQLYLAYEIPKWDGDLSRPSVYVPLTDGYRPAEGRAAAQELPVAAVPRLVGRRGVPRPGPAARHGVPGQLRRVIPLLQIYASWRNKPVTIK